MVSLSRCREGNNLASDHGAILQILQEHSDYGMFCVVLEPCQHFLDPFRTYIRHNIGWLLNPVSNYITLRVNHPDGSRVRMGTKVPRVVMTPGTWLPDPL